ncbi:cupin domain-containing protein [Sessilibacter corallicola]|uniref:cupin domain-containing protein n=1 Tax=Sessilibacter corallicola TaxID=2904075 RepID=UPI001E5A38BC|nr:cupin domain-containing protein [Sessilibacter corallicola]MCE2028594.1 cupin domain-containing protein [Sessilibacter corallicola]
MSHHINPISIILGALLLISQQTAFSETSQTPFSSDESATTTMTDVSENDLSIQALVKTLNLEPHIEGGYYRRTYQADHRDKLNTAEGERFLLTSIYYLLTQDSAVGHWHHNKSDIIHYYHLGSPITYYLIHENGELEVVRMGNNPLAGEQLQLVVKGGTWKASHLETGNYGLISEAVAPGFDFKDMSLGVKQELLAQFPQHADVINQFSKH